jgi:hypothetical protein
MVPSVHCSHFIIYSHTQKSNSIQCHQLSPSEYYSTRKLRVPETMSDDRRPSPNIINGPSDRADNTGGKNK